MACTNEYSQVFTRAVGGNKPKDLFPLQVVMSVAQLYWHLAPRHEVNIVTKSLVRLLRSHRYGQLVSSEVTLFLIVLLLFVWRREVQYVVLQNIATMSIQRKVSAYGQESNRRTQAPG